MIAHCQNVLGTRPAGVAGGASPRSFALRVDTSGADGRLQMIGWAPAGLAATGDVAESSGFYLYLVGCTVSCRFLCLVVSCR